MSVCAVIGLGQLGESVARYLAEHRVEVIAIDTNLARVEKLKDVVAHAVCLDATDERALRAAGVGDASSVVLALGEGQLEQAVMATMILRELGVGQIVSRAANDLQGKVLARLGVSRVVFPERQVGQELARQLINPSVLELVPLSDGTSVAELAVGDDLAGKSIGDASIRREYGLNVVVVKHRDEYASDDGQMQVRWRVNNTPGPATVLGKGDVLVVVGADEAISQWVERH